MSPSDLEFDLKKSVLSQMMPAPDHTDLSDSGSGTFTSKVKELQRELRIAKKAEDLAKSKLTTTSKALEKAKKDLSQLKLEYEERIE